MSKLYQRKKLGKVITFLFISFLNTGVALAAIGDAEKLSKLFEIIYDILFPVAILISLVLIILNGYSLLTSEGEPRKVQTAKENLTSAILGLVFVLSAFAIYRVVVESFFAVDFPG